MDTKARTPKVTTTWPFGQISTDTFSYSWATGTHPSVQFTAYGGARASEAATQVLDEKLAKKLGEIQTKAYSNRSKPDCTFKVDDGNKGKLDFEGFLVGPSFVLEKRSYRPAVVAMGSAALLSNLKLEIYNVNNSREQADSTLSEGLMMLPTMSKSPNLATRLKDLTKHMIRFWEANKGGSGTNRVAEGIKSTVHKVNGTGALEAWNGLLSNSEQYLKLKWLKTVSENSHFNMQFNQMLIDLLRSPVGDFMDTINELCRALQLIMIPSLDGKPGYLIPTAEAVVGKSEDLTVPETGVMMNGPTSQRLLPVQQVLLKGLPRESHLIPGELQGARESDGTLILGGFPASATVETGNVQYVDLPIQLQMVLLAQGSAQVAGARPPDTRMIASGFKRVSDYVGRLAVKAAQELVEEYARSCYVEMALAGTSVSLRIPLDVSVKPGKRCKVSNTRGVHLFDGFLAGLQHSITKTPGSGSAQTSLNFTHVTFGDFKLPGL